MGGLFGGGPSTQTTVQQPAAPQLLPEGKEGFLAANQYFKDFLSQPPIYGGPRTADVAPLQATAFDSAASTLGSTSPTSNAANLEIQRTLSGDYLNGPGAKAAVSGLAAPIFNQFEQQVMPGIRDRAQFAGQGVGSTRRDVAEGAAINELGRGIGTGAIAPIYTNERQQMSTEAGLTPKLDESNIQRVLSLLGVGATQQAQSQAQIDAARQAFEEPIFRQTGAADALSSQGGLVTPGGGTTTTYGSQPSNIVGTLGPLALMGKMLAK